MQLNSSTIPSILQEIQADAARRDEAYQNFLIYEGKLGEFVQKEVQAKYPRTWKDYTIADYNLLKKVTDKKTKSYKKAPIRKLEKDVETERYAAVLSEGDFDSAMKLVDRYHNQYRYCAVGIVREKDAEGKSFFNFWALQPFEFSVIRDRNENIVCWAIPNGKQGEYAYWTLWTNEGHAKVITKDYKSYAVVENKGNPGNINPFKTMPFVYVPADISGRYPLASTLVNKSIAVNTNLSVYLTSGNMQIGQLVIKHPASQAVGEVVSGLRVAMDLPQLGGDKGETSAEYISPSPDLEGHKNSILLYMMLILDENGITSTKLGNADGESFTSGFDRLIANADIQDIIEDNQSIYAKIENRVYQIIKSIHVADGDITFSSKQLSITYLQPEIMLSDSDKLDNLAKKKALGLWEDWELIKEANPNISEADARLKADKLKASRNGNIENGSVGIP